MTTRSSCLQSSRRACASLYMTNAQKMSIITANTSLARPRSLDGDLPVPSAQPARDPLIYWGYLVKRRFMAGEMYALSWSLVDWVSKEPAVRGLVNGAEDKQTAKWMRLHPRAAQVRWVAERCWIYDHPRSGTVCVLPSFNFFVSAEHQLCRYSHGFLFPSEVDRVRQGVRAFFDRQPLPPTDQTTTSRYDRDWNAPPEWSLSTVSTFGTRYALPLPNLTIPQSIEALVEGSDMSGHIRGCVVYFLSHVSAHSVIREQLVCR
jgi:hypothetical protein